MEVARSHEVQRIRGGKARVWRITELPHNGMPLAVSQPLPAASSVIRDSPQSGLLALGREESRWRGGAKIPSVHLRLGGNTSVSMHRNQLVAVEAGGGLILANHRSPTPSAGGEWAPVGARGGGSVMAQWGASVPATRPSEALGTQGERYTADDGRGVVLTVSPLVSNPKVLETPAVTSSKACLASAQLQAECDAAQMVRGEAVCVKGGLEEFGCELGDSKRREGEDCVVTVVGDGRASEGLAGSHGAGIRKRKTLLVGVAFMAKKMETMAKVMPKGVLDGVEFRPLDLNRSLEQGNLILGGGADGEGAPAVEGGYPRVDIILHKLSEDVMYRETRVESDRRLQLIEDYVASNPGTSMVDPIEKVAHVINRVDTLKLLRCAYQKYGSAGGMPRPPHFMVLDQEAYSECRDLEALGRKVSSSGLAYPMICKPIEACGTRGSHTMLVVLDKSGLADITAPIVVQEHCNHDGKLYKVCVVGDHVRVSQRSSLPNLPPGLTGSFSFDSQAPYPSLEEVRLSSAARYSAAATVGEPAKTGVKGEMVRSVVPGAEARRDVVEVGVERGVTDVEGKGVSEGLGSGNVLTHAAACLAAERLKEAFGLSIFGFDIIVESGSGDPMVIDVNYFPSFKDLPDFPQVLRRHLKAVSAEAMASAGI